MSRILITGGATIGAQIAQYLDDQGCDIYQDLEGKNPVGLINSIQHETVKLNAQASSQSFIHSAKNARQAEDLLMTILYAYIAALILTVMIIVVFGLAVYWEASHQKRCKHTTTIKLSSMQKQICADCNKTIPWPLKKNQPPLVTSSRDKRK